MTVKELKDLLQKCNDEDLVKINVRKFSNKKEEIVDETYEEPQLAIYEVYLDNVEQDSFVLSVTLYED